MKKFIKLFICLLFVFAIGFLASCDENSYEYPSKYQTISNGNGEYLSYNGFKMTNEEMYYYMLSKFGVETLGDIVDATLFTKNVDEYSSDVLTDEEKAGLKKIYAESLEETVPTVGEDKDYSEIIKIGLNTTQGSFYNYETYYAEQFNEYVAAYIEYRDAAKENDEDAKNVNSSSKATFSDEDYVNWFNDHYFANNVSVLLVTWATFEIARQEIIDHNLAEGTAVAFYDAGADRYDLEDLKKISSTGSEDLTIYNKALTFKAEGDHTTGALAYGSRFYEMYALEINEEYSGGYTAAVWTDADHDALTDETKAALYNEMILDKFASLSTVETYVAKTAQEKRNEAGLQIYYEGLETNYVYAYDKVYTTLSIVDNDDFATASLEKDNCIALWNVNGQEKKLTADEMFAKLNERYGAIVNLTWLEGSLYLNNSSVVKLENGKYVSNTGGATSDSYATYLKAAVTEIKSNFENNNYKSYGYKAVYGWENFIRDYFGVTNEAQLVYASDSDLFEDAESSYYTNKIKPCKISKVEDTWYMNADLDDKIAITAQEAIDFLETGKEYSLVVKSDSDNVQFVKIKYTDESETECYIEIAKLVDLYNQINSAKVNFTATLIKMYVDDDLDGVADEDTSMYVNNFDMIAINMIQNAEPEQSIDATTFASKLEKQVYEQYKKAPSDEYRFAVVSSQSYTTVDLDDPVAVKAKELADAFLAFRDGDLSGNSIDPLYRYVEDDTVKLATVYDLYFPDMNTINNIKVFNANDNTCYFVFVTKATKVSDGSVSYALTDLVSSANQKVRMLAQINEQLESISDANLKATMAALAEISFK